MQPSSCYNFSMSFFISLGIVLLAMLIMALLQLQPGVFLLLCHHSTGKYPKTHVSHLTLFFILGVEVISACLFLSIYYITNIFFLQFFRPETSFWAFIAVGIFIALALICLFGYFRGSRGTRLFISRKYAQILDQKARTVKSPSDAFTLGAFSGLAELIFTIPLYIITSLEIIEMSVEFSPSHLLTLLYIITPTIPLFIIRWRFQAGHNLVDIQKSRVRHKDLTRLTLFASYLAIAILIIIFRITI